MLMKHLSKDFKSATRIYKSGLHGEVQARERNLKVMSQTDSTESDGIRWKHLQNDLRGTELGLGTYQLSEMGEVGRIQHRRLKRDSH